MAFIERRGADGQRRRRAGRWRRGATRSWRHGICEPRVQSPRGIHRPASPTSTRTRTTHVTTTVSLTDKTAPDGADATVVLTRKGPQGAVAVRTAACPTRGGLTWTRCCRRCGPPARPTRCSRSPVSATPVSWSSPPVPVCPAYPPPPTRRPYAAPRAPRSPRCTAPRRPTWRSPAWIRPCSPHRSKAVSSAPTPTRPTRAETRRRRSRPCGCTPRACPGKDAKALLARAQTVASAQNWARDLVNMPALDLYPESFAQAVRERFAGTKVTVEVADEAQLAKDDCGGLVGVGRGSARPPRLVTLTYKPRKASAHLALVGKGITFDSGGLCIKPAGGMVDDEVRHGRRGRGRCAGVRRSPALRPARRGHRAGCACAENMPGGDAHGPVTSRRCSTARPSRSSTPTPRAGWCWPTASARRQRGSRT